MYATISCISKAKEKKLTNYDAIRIITNQDMHPTTERPFKSKI